MPIPVIHTTKEHEDRLIAALRTDDGAARAELLVLLQPLIAAIAAKYDNRHPANTGVSVSELIELGNKGLEKALRYYHLPNNFKFSTYATWWIRAEIHRRLSLRVD